MSAKHLLAIASTSEAVNDHRLFNFLRNSPAEKLTVLTAEDLNKMARDQQADLLTVLDRWCAEHQDAEFDMVWCNVWHMEFAALMLWAKETMGAKIVLDHDDLHVLPDHHPAKGHEYSLAEEARVALKSVADLLTNSTPFLRDLHGGIVCPNFADPENWVADEKLPLGRWTHRIACPISASRVIEWEDLMGDTFQKLLEDFPEVQWVFLGGWPEMADHAPSGQVVRGSWAPNWLYKRMMQWLQPTVMLSPLFDVDFNKAKSNIKYLEAGLIGAAFVGSPVGELARTVVHEETGLITSDIEGSLRRVLTDPELHATLAQNAKVDVLSNWTWPAVKDQWEEIWKCLSSSQPVS